MGDSSRNIAVDVKELRKTFKLPLENHSGIKQVIINSTRRKKGYEIQKVLKGISFEIEEGDFFGIVGRNGSGKSTLLKLLAGIYTPDSGSVQISGSLTPFIELGVGFNPELTGYENVFLNGALLGFSRDEMEEMYDDIVKFAELEKFMDQRLKNYSSGMQVRLAFSIAIRARSDILLLDEVLAVGDAIFQKKCFDYFKELKRNKQTVILVSHDAGVLREYCNKGVLIEQGEVVFQGPIDDVVMRYLDILNEVEEASSEGAIDSPSKSVWGSGEVEVVKAETLAEEQGDKRKIFADDNKDIFIRTVFRSNKSVDAPIYGITITDGQGIRSFQSNTLWRRIETLSLKHGQQVEIVWQIPNVFNTGTYSVAPAAASRDGSKIYQWQEGAAIFKVRKAIESSAIINTDHGIKVITE